MNPVVGPFGYKSYSHMIILMDNSITIRNDTGNIIKSLEETHLLSGFNVLHENEASYLVSSIGVYDVESSEG